MRIKETIFLLAAVCLVTGCKRKSFDEYLSEEAEKFTATQCPRELDRTITIDSMVYDVDHRTLNYYYSLSEEFGDKDIVTPSLIEDFTETMLVRLRDDITLKKHKEENIYFAYNYYFKKDKEPAFSIKFGPKDYFGKLNLHSFNYREVRNLREFNRKNCPMRQDSCTVLDSMWYDSISRTYYYDYSVNGSLDDDSLYTSFVKKELKKQLITGIKEDNGIEIERDKEKLNFAFRYFSASKKRLLLEQVIKNDEIK